MIQVVLHVFQVEIQTVQAVIQIFPKYFSMVLHSSVHLAAQTDFIRLILIKHVNPVILFVSPALVDLFQIALVVINKEIFLIIIQI